MRIFLGNVYKKQLHFSEVETSHGSVDAGYGAERRTGQVCSRLKHMGRWFVEHFKEQELGKETQEKLLKAMHRNRSKITDRKNGDCNQWTSKGQNLRGDSCSTTHDKQKKGKEEDPFLSPKREDTRNTEGKPKGTSPSGKSNKVVCTCIQKGDCQKTPACGCWHPPECPHHNPLSDCKWWDACVFKHTGKAGDDTHGYATVGRHLEQTKGLNCAQHWKTPEERLSQYDLV